jgi:hypothetical protein
MTEYITKEQAEKIAKEAKMYCDEESQYQFEKYLSDNFHKAINLAFEHRLEVARLVAESPDSFVACDDIYILPHDFTKKAHFEKNGFEFKPLYTLKGDSK